MISGFNCPLNQAIDFWMPGSEVPYPGVRKEEHVLQAHVGADRLRLRCQTESIWISLTRHFPIRNTRKTNIKMAILGTQFLGQATWPHFNLNHRCPDQTAQAWDSNEFEPAPHAPFFL
jgi:hypothetical protein